MLSCCSYMAGGIVFVSCILCLFFLVSSAGGHEGNTHREILGDTLREIHQRYITVTLHIPPGP